MKRGPAITAVVFYIFLAFAPSGIAGPPSSAVGLSPDSGPSQSFIYTPLAEDAKAFFFRLTTENSRCVLLDYNVTMDFWETPPFIQADAHGVTEHRGDVAYDRLQGWGSSGQYAKNDERTYHFKISSSAVNYQQESGYNEKSNVALGRYWSTSCSYEPEPLPQWFAIVIAAPVRNVSVRLSFYEFFDDSDPLNWQLAEGNATGTVTFRAESNRTFLRQLKDFDGVSYNGDPFHLGAGPSALAVEAETTINTTRGFLGGFLDLAASPGKNEASLLSFQGPGGEAGAGSDVTPGSPIPKESLLHIAGSAGDWRFRAHGYVAPVSFSSLMVWGADIETRTPDPNLDTLDADRDSIPDAAEDRLCAVQNDNRDIDGTCPNRPNYQPPAGTPNPRNP